LAEKLWRENFGGKLLAGKIGGKKEWVPM